MEETVSKQTTKDQHWLYETNIWVSKCIYITWKDRQTWRACLQFVQQCFALIMLLLKTVNDFQHGEPILLFLRKKKIFVHYSLFMLRYGSKLGLAGYGLPKSFSCLYMGVFTIRGWIQTQSNNSEHPIKMAPLWMTKWEGKS